MKTIFTTCILTFVFFSSCASPDVKETATKKETNQLWTCGMHPQVIQEHPGECPICHMKLTPLAVDAPKGTEAGTSTPALTIDPSVVQNMGVRTVEVTDGVLTRTLRVAGYLAEAQPNVRDVNLLVSGWIRQLYANTEGMHLKQGEPLFDLYSPELQVAVEELIAARRSQNTAAGAQSQTAKTLYDASFKKLELWGIPRPQIETLAKLDAAPDTVTFRSPISGHLVKKAVAEGAAVKAGDQILQIVDHSVLWADAQVFEQHLPFVSLGQKGKITVIANPGQSYDATAIFIHPHLDMMTRTATVRFEIPNKELDLKPGMYATVAIETRAPTKALLVPREAVVDTGARQIAFVAKGEGHFEARDVTMGLSGDDGTVQILAGLSTGERVVTSGQFLLDAESRLREAVQKFLAEKNEQKNAGR